ncbi:hypothetical protein [Rubrivivax rivuli]|uniref:Uncharacterized protein n=1 Tax=Rubrivivax rivuli TaxID=1862385 RepID=A0A437RI55_9BURK|nr:hypothetical protein [Rubrivivax rivuli]RVU46419.1 hypothetical protein EOE66_11340 [Rubrivivax rivuli]
MPTLTEVVDLAVPALDIGPEFGPPLGPDEGAADDEAARLHNPAGDSPPEMPPGPCEPLPPLAPQPLDGEGDVPPVVRWEGIDAPTADVGEAEAAMWDAGLPRQGMPEPAPPVDTHALVALALAELQPRLDMLLEARLREALAPALARAAEGLIREARGELASALNELLHDAVRRALQRQAVQTPAAELGPPHRP